MSRKLSRIEIPAGLVPGRVMAADREPTITDIAEKVGKLGTGIEQFKAHHNSKLESIEASVADLDKELRGINVKVEAARTTGSFDVPGVMSQGDRLDFTNFARGKYQAAMSTQSNPDGGYLVPETVDTLIGQIAANISPMRSVCNVVVAGERYSKLMNMQGETATWGGETTAPSETQGMKLAELTYPTGVLQAMPKVTNNLLDDASVDVAAELSTGIARAFSASEGLAFLKGDGINKPRGLMTYPVVANASYAWGSIGYIVSGDASGFVAASSTVSPSDCLVGVVYSLQAEYRANASWMMNSDTARVVRLWKDTIGRPIWTDSIAEGQPPRLLGYPVAFNEDMDAIASNKFPIAFGDFSRAYLIHDLPQGIRVLRDPYSFKPYTAFYTTKRVGGGILDFGAVKFLKISG